MSTEAMKLALEALERYQVKRQDFDRFADEITALREALAEQPAQQEPVLTFYEHEWQGKTSRAYQWLIDPFSLPEGTKLYTSPPAQPQPEPVAGCVCRWNSEGDRVVTCERHQGWLEVIAEWADRAREAEKKLKFLMNTSPPAQQEPVEYWTVANGWVSDQAEVPAAVWVEPDFWEHCNRVNCGTAYRLPAPGRQPLYTSPPAQRKPLTDEEIETVWRSVQANDFHDCVKPFARAIEAAHGIEENT